MNKTKIEWTDRTWNPVTGCTKVSQGCKNCYAERLYERFNGPHSFKKVLTHPERLQQPLKWKQPSKIFVNSMSDLFHEDVPFYFIDHVFMTMALCNQHIFQILTKRPERMIEYFSNHPAEILKPGFLPLKNVWLGVSVEDQATANERIPLLLQVPASIRFLSCEPLLGQIWLRSVIEQNYGKDIYTDYLTGINWVIVGGESGPKARPMHPDWARSIRDQCKEAGVPFFFKQWGEYGAGSSTAGKNIIVANNGKTFTYPEFAAIIKSSEGRAEHNFSRINSMSKIGKKAAGNLLDGVQHMEFPTNQQITTK